MSDMQFIRWELIPQVIITALLTAPTLLLIIAIAMVTGPVCLINQED